MCESSLPIVASGTDAPECQRPEQMPHIAIRLVKAALLELFHHYTALHFEALLAESQLQHTVGLQPKGCLYVRLRNGEVVIGYVIIGPGIVFSPANCKGVS